MSTSAAESFDPFWRLHTAVIDAIEHVQYDDGSASHARFLPEMCQLLDSLTTSLDKAGESLLGMEARALLAGHRGDLEAEIGWQIKVVAAKQVCLDGSGDPAELARFMGFDWGDVVRECIILAALQAEAERLGDTDETLRLADAIAKAHGIPFDRETEWNELRS